MEAIQIAVVKADMFICAFVAHWPWLIVGIAFGGIVGKVIYRCLEKK